MHLHFLGLRLDDQLCMNFARLTAGIFIEEHLNLVSQDADPIEPTSKDGCHFFRVDRRVGKAICILGTDHHQLRRRQQIFPGATPSIAQQ